LSYPPDKRAEVGDVIDDLPAKSVKWLLAKGHIEEVKGSASPRPAAPVFATTSEEDED
jgi:serine/threonine-protein kinase RIO1